MPRSKTKKGKEKMETDIMPEIDITPETYIKPRTRKGKEKMETDITPERQKKCK